MSFVSAASPKNHGADLNRGSDMSQTRRLTLPRSALLGTAAAFALMIACAQPAAAQSAPPTGPVDFPPAFQSVDQNGVELVTGRLITAMPTLTIGSGPGALVYSRSFETITQDVGGNLESAWTDNYAMSLQFMKLGASQINIAFLATSSSTEIITTIVETLELNKPYDADKRDGSTLTRIGENLFKYVDRYGTEYRFENFESDLNGRYGHHVKSIKSPNGLIIDIEYALLPATTAQPYTSRIRSIKSNGGYQLFFNYQVADEVDASGAPSNLDDWDRLINVVGINNTAFYCPENKNTCNPDPPSVGQWPSLTFSYGKNAGNNNHTDITVTDAANSSTKFTMVPASGFTYTRFLRLLRKGYPQDNTASFDAVTYEGNTGRVSTFVRSLADGKSSTDQYSYSCQPAPSGCGEAERLTEVRNLSYIPDDETRKRSYYSSPNTAEVGGGVITRMVDESGLQTKYNFDGFNRETSVTTPSGIRLVSQYDERGNIIATARFASGITSVDFKDAYSKTYANFLESCHFNTNKSDFAYINRCNKPVSITDARGNTTNFTYDSAHGGVTKIESPPVNYTDRTGPAPITTPLRPRTDIYYAQYRAKASSDPGPLFTTDIWLPFKTTSCRTWNTCPNTANETVQILTFGDNLLPVAETMRSGNWGQTSDPGIGQVYSKATIGYTPQGDIRTLSGMLGGDSIRMRYDGARRLTDVIGPVATGAASGVRRATRTTYNADGQAIEIAQGTVIGTLDDTEFAPLERAYMTYDRAGRLTKTESGGAGSSDIRTVLEYSYDVEDRLVCTALRMGGGTSADACSNVSSETKDRISQTQYRKNGSIEKLVSGIGTSDKQDTATFAYTSTGLVQSMTNARGHTTKYFYDTLDRLQTLQYPTLTLQSGGNKIYAETYGYDQADNVTLFTARDGLKTEMLYDALGRLSYVDPGTTKEARSYEYDLFGQLLLAGTNDDGIVNTYDALSRLTSTGDGFRNTFYAYDPASRRSQMTWFDGYAVTYAYNLYNEIVEIKEAIPANWGDSVTLATYGYDNLGRRAWMGRGNAVPTIYEYNSRNQLSAIKHGTFGTTLYQQYSFTYNNASQLTDRVSSNPLYAPPAPVAGTKAYGTPNALDQYDSINGNALTWTSRGGLQTDGGAVMNGGPARSYSYDRFNRLVQVLQGNDTVMSLTYDAGGRLLTTASGASPTDATRSRYLYDGEQAIAELTGLGAIRRRFVPGPGLDNIIVQIDHDGGGVPERRWILSDDLGSVAALTDRTGKAIRFNAYGPFGEPSAGNIGRMGWAGALTLPEIGMVHLRARAYAPNLGRFIQPDPIGTAGGINLYAYADGDPVNGVDPLGLRPCTADVCVTEPRNPLLEACQGTRGLNCSTIRGAPLISLPEFDPPNLIEIILVTACRVEGVSRCEAGEDEPDDKKDEHPVCDTRPVFNQATAANVGYGPVSAIYDIQSYSGIGTLGVGLARAVLKGGEASDLARWNRKAYNALGLEGYSAAADMQGALRAADALVINALRNDANTQARRIMFGCRGRIF